MRTIKEIKDKIKDKIKERIKGRRGWFGHDHIEVLESCLCDESYKDPLLLKKKAVDYLSFAFDKAIDHRGLSAIRSVEKMGAYCWLLGWDDCSRFAEDANNYACYGVPVLKHIAKALDVIPPEEILSWEDGQPCEKDCEGCNG